jgi:membrane-bound metal-dependent hydrolase YbcI (DUF457 family)
MTIQEFDTRTGARVLWHTLCLPVLAFLLILEPVIQLVLSILALLGVFTAFFGRFFTAAQHFPFWSLLAASITCMLLLMGYRRLIQFLSN